MTRLLCALFLGLLLSSPAGANPVRMVNGQLVELTDAETAELSAEQTAAAAAQARLEIDVAYQTALAQGVTITCAPAATVCNSNVAGTYALDDTARTNITGEWAYYNSTGQTSFTSGTNAVTWTDVAGLAHTFTAPQFVAFAQLVAVHYRKLNTTKGALLAGASVAWPEPTETMQ